MGLFWFGGEYIAIFLLIFYVFFDFRVSICSRRVVVLVCLVSLDLWVVALSFIYDFFVVLLSVVVGSYWGEVGLFDFVVGVAVSLSCFLYKRGELGC